MDTTTREQNRTAMFGLIEQYKASGLSQKRFCQEHTIAISQFYYWHKRYRESQAEQGFVPVKIFSGRNKIPVANLEIQYPNGVLLRLPVNTPLNYIRALMAGM